MSEPCRPGLEHLFPCYPLGDGSECACGCGFDETYCMQQFRIVRVEEGLNAGQYEICEHEVVIARSTSLSQCKRIIAAILKVPT